MIQILIAVADEYFSLKFTTYLQLIFNFCQLLRKDASFFPACIDFLLENLCSPLENLHQARLSHITDIVALVLDNYALGAYVDLIVFAEELCPFVRVLQAVFLSWLLLLLKLLFFLLGADMPLTVEIIQYGEILDQLFDIWAKIASACWTCKNVARSKVHKTMLAEGVSTGEYARDLLLVIVLIKTDRTSHFHPVIVIAR